MRETKHSLMFSWRGNAFVAFITYYWMNTELDFVELIQPARWPQTRPLLKNNYFCGFFRLHHLRRERDVQDFLSDFVELRFNDERNLPY